MTANNVSLATDTVGCQYRSLCRRLISCLSRRYNTIRRDVTLQFTYASSVFWTITLIFGRPFVKRFALCCRNVVLSVYNVTTLVYCGQTVGRIKMPLGWEVGHGSGYTVLDRDVPAPSPKGAQHLPHFSAHVYLSYC